MTHRLSVSILILSLIPVSALGADRSTGIKLSALGGLGLSFENKGQVLKNSTTTFGKPVGGNAGLGLLLEFPLFKKLGLEGGFFYFRRSFSYMPGSVLGLALTNTEIDVNETRIIGAALLRFDFANFFSMGIGPFYGKTTGSVNVKNYSGITAQEVSDNVKRTDWGGSMAITLSPKLFSVLHLLLEYRMFVGATEMSNVDLSFFTGAQLFF